MTDPRPVPERLRSIANDVRSYDHAVDSVGPIADQLDAIAEEVAIEIEESAVRLLKREQERQDAQARVERLEGVLEWIVEGRWGAGELANQARAVLAEAPDPNTTPPENVVD